MADPLHQFVVTPIIPIEIGGIDLSFTNSSLWMVIGAVLSTVFLTMSMKRKSLVPSRAQAMAEMMYEFIAGMVRENIGTAGRQYFPLIFTLFMVVLMGNLLGLVPYSFTYTSHLIVTAALALVIFFTVLVLGVARHGMHFFSLFVPPGVPVWLFPLIIPIELISFLIRPVTLSVRLFANMMAGHLMLKVFAGFSVAMFAALGAKGLVPGLLPLAFNTILTAFELMIALIHAYVFTVLSCIYLKDTVDLHH
ncbi:F0F1 ATP synthase subunit A [Micavibrio aeruginosavorus]|uniref:F0F1 ATP synthase subunit A n=1 Tax=Micavibrio aeruginosavorus TaxID=349221 RepID=UPI003F4AF66A